MSNVPSLPSESWIHIASFLLCEGRIALAGTCSTMNSLIYQTPSIWIVLCTSYTYGQPFSLCSRTRRMLFNLREKLTKTVKLGVRQIYLDYMTINQYHLENLLQPFPNLRLLSLDFCSGLTLSALANTLKRLQLPFLRFLNLREINLLKSYYPYPYFDLRASLLDCTGTQDVILNVCLCPNCAVAALYAGFPTTTRASPSRSGTGVKDA